MNSFKTILLIFFVIPWLSYGQSGNLSPGQLQINGGTPPVDTSNIVLRCDSVGNNYFNLISGVNRSSYINLIRGSDESQSAYVSYGPIRVPPLSNTNWRTGIGTNLFSSSNDFEISQVGNNPSFFLESYFTAFSIDAQSKETIMRNASGNTLALENGNNSASLLIKSYEDGFLGTNDYAGFLFQPDTLGNQLSLYATSLNNGFGGVVSSINTIAHFKSNGNLELSGSLELGNIELENAGSSNLTINSDFIPSTSAPWDLGNNVPNQSWDDVVADDFINVSDRRLKKQIHAIDYGLEDIMQLDPVQYKYIKDMDDEKDHLGLIAQDVVEIIPEIVATHDVDIDSTGQLVRKENEYLGINYVALIPVLIQSIQEQQSIIESLEDKKNALAERLERIEKHLGLEPAKEEESIVLNRGPQLEQNVPNPAKGNTQIQYFLPREVNRAELRIFDTRGRLLKSTVLKTQPGKHTVNLELNQLPAGGYSYGLYVNGAQIQTRTLLVVE